MPRGYDLRLLEYVCTIAATGSISAASGQLHVSQPTLTRQLGNLERHLGSTLFERLPGGVRPTKAGEVLVARATTILRGADLLDEDMRAAAAGRSGRLRLGFVGSAINGPLGAAIVRLRLELPQVELDLQESFDDRVLTAELRSGDLDIAVHRLPTRHPILTSRPWAREPMSVFLPHDHRLARDTSELPLTGLRSLDLVMWPRDAAPQAYDEVLALLQRASATPRMAATAHTVQAILALVAHGVGAAVMSDSYRTLRRVGVLCRPLAGQVVTHYLTTSSHPLPPVVQNAVRVLEERPRQRPEVG